MHNYRLIVSDLDGTMLDEHSELTPRTVAAAQKIREAGAELALCSGRMGHAMLDYAGQLEVTLPMITYNGAAVADPVTAKVLKSYMIPASGAREICAFAEGFGLHTQLYRDNLVICEKSNDFMEYYVREMHTDRVKISATGRPLSQVVDYEVPKVLMISTVERVAQLLPVFREHFAGRYTCVTSNPRYLEVIPIGVDKGRAMTALCGELSVPLDRVAAFGDAINDLPMLQAAGLGVAMANASEAVRAGADEVAGSNREDGWAIKIEEMISAGLIGGEA